MSLSRFSLHFVFLSLLFIVVSLAVVKIEGEFWSYQQDSLLFHTRIKTGNSDYVREKNLMSQSTASSYILGEWTIAYYDYFTQAPDYKLIPVGQLNIRETSYHYTSFGGETDTVQKELLFVQAPDGAVRCTNLIEGTNDDLVRRALAGDAVAKCEFIYGDMNQSFLVTTGHLYNSSQDYGQVWILLWIGEPGRMSPWAVFKKTP